MAIAGKTAKAVQDYIDDNGPVYPARAERETLMGVTWPVKGIEHRVVEAPESVDFKTHKTYDSDAGLGTYIINKTCTLTGTFTKTVTVKPEADSTIYIRLMNVNFESPVRPDADGIDRVTNEAKIVVDESSGGKVYFVLAGLYVTSNYEAKYDDDVSSKKLLKTVYDWMHLFALDNDEQREYYKRANTDFAYYEISENTEDIKKAILCGTSYGNNFSYVSGKIVAGILKVFGQNKKRATLIENMSLKAWGKGFENGNWLSRDNAVLEKYNADPLCGGSFPISFYRSLFNNMTRVNKGIKHINKNIKILLIVGDKDPVSSGGKLVKKLYKKYIQNGLTATIKLYPGARHELINETNKEYVYKDIIDFYNN